jgi:hypothetical protein
VLCLFAGLLWLALPTGSARAELQIHELLADPASDWNGDGEVTAAGDEWIELINSGPAEVDLTDYWLRDASGDDPHFRFAGTLEPGAVVLIHGSDALAWQAANGFGATGLSLNNSGDTVELLFGPAAGELTVTDSVVFLDHEADDDRASGRLLETGVWTLFDGLNPYGGTKDPVGSGCDPSPGAPNDCQPGVPVRPATWTDLKAQYVR